MSGNTGDQFVIARNYLDTVSNQIALPALVGLEKAKITAMIFGSLSFRWGLAVWGVSIPGFPAFILMERIIDFLLLLLTPFVASLMVQILGLEILKATAIPFVLPAGVVLRIFPPTRDAGSYLIACSVAFGLVFPYTYVMHKKIVYDTLMQYDNGSDESIEAHLSQTGSDYPNLLQTVNSSNVWRVTDMLDWMRSLSYLLLQALFLPALSITLTVSFIKGFTKFLSQKLE
jgi:hypothetical protein